MTDRPIAAHTDPGDEPQTPRQRLWRLLEDRPTRDRRALIIDQVILWLIVINVVAVILESDPRLSVRHLELFFFINLVSVAAFTVEYMLRVWVSVEARPELSPLRARLGYMRSPLAIIDLLAILPFYLGTLLGIDLRMLRALRLLRILKLTRYFSGITVLTDVLRAEARPMGAALMVMLILMVLASSGIYWAEHRAQPEVFRSIPASMWWTMVTLTTVGYGDVVPVTTLGRVMGAVIMLLGIGMVALPAGMLASRFSDELHQRREDFSREVDHMLEDGKLSGAESSSLEELRETLLLTEEEAEEILEQKRSRRAAAARCPHCGGALDAAARSDPGGSPSEPGADGGRVT
jgi:voltage-gated potassium channel